MDLRSLEMKVGRTENLPVLPQVVSSLIKLVDLPNTSARQLEQLIQTDLAITAKILKVANSSYYGFSNVNSVGRAVGCLGLTAIRSLVLSVAYQQLISGRPQSSAFSPVDFWRHSLAVGAAARIIGKQVLPAKCNELYDAGMMHDIGILVMDRFCPAELDSAIRTSIDDGLPLHETEERMYGYCHADIGAMVADKWGLQGLLKNAIKFHHRPLEVQEFKRTTCIIAMSNLLAHQCGYTNNVPNLPQTVDTELMENVGIKEEEYGNIAAMLVGEVTKAEEALKIAC